LPIAENSEATRLAGHYITPLRLINPCPAKSSQAPVALRQWPWGMVRAGMPTLPSGGQFGFSHFLAFSPSSIASSAEEPHQLNSGAPSSSGAACDLDDLPASGLLKRAEFAQELKIIVLIIAVAQYFDRFRMAPNQKKLSRFAGFQLRLEIDT
jgi:hypothetical protein